MMTVTLVSSFYLFLWFLPTSNFSVYIAILYLDVSCVLVYYPGNKLWKSVASHYLSQFVSDNFIKGYLKPGKLSKLNFLCFSVSWLILKVQTIHDHPSIHPFCTSPEIDSDKMLLLHVIIFASILHKKFK